VVMVNVGMNIEDKDLLFQEFVRVLKPGGRVGVFDIMQLVPEIPAPGLPFPMPWASTAECSFVREPESYRQSAANTGKLVLEREENQWKAVIIGVMLQKQLAAAVADIGEGGAKAPPQAAPLAINILMGPSLKEKGPNLGGVVQAGHIRPVELIFRRERHNTVYS
jgi:hypothetical protein